MGSHQSRHSSKLNAVVWSRPDTAAPSGPSASCTARACIRHCWASSFILSMQQQMWSEEQGILLRRLPWAKVVAALGLRSAGSLRCWTGHVKPFVYCGFLLRPGWTNHLRALGWFLLLRLFGGLGFFCWVWTEVRVIQRGCPVPSFLKLSSCPDTTMFSLPHCHTQRLLPTLCIRLPLCSISCVHWECKESQQLS